jgi:hypothetical protein
MSDWIETNNGNYVYVLDTDEVMTVFHRDGKWSGVYDNRFTDGRFETAEEAMALMEKAVLGNRLDLLIKWNPPPVGWRKTKTGGYHIVRKDCTMTVKQAKSGKWYLIVGQTMVQGKWFNTAEEARRQGDQL